MIRIWVKTTIVILIFIAIVITTIMVIMVIMVIIVIRINCITELWSDCHRHYCSISSHSHYLVFFMILDPKVEGRPYQDGSVQISRSSNRPSVQEFWIIWTIGPCSNLWTILTIHIPNTKYAKQNTKYTIKDIPSTPYEIPNTPCQIPNTPIQIAKTPLQIPSKPSQRMILMKHDDFLLCWIGTNLSSFCRK